MRKIKGDKMTKKQREEIAKKTNGRCAYCGEALAKGWHADHIEPVIRNGCGMERPENDTIGNMIAACPSCNLLKTSGTVDQLRESIKDRTRQLRRQASYRTAMRYGLIEEIGKEIVFYFEEEVR